MRTLDRYVTRSFLWSFVLLFLVVMSLRVIVDMSINMDEFLKIKVVENGRERDATVQEKTSNIVAYYTNQSVMYIPELGGIIIVISAAFTLGRMNHSNELTAMLASGVSLRRVVLPIIACAVLLDVLIVLDQEYLVPQMADKLVRNRDEAFAKNHYPIRLMTDDNATVWLAKSLRPDDKQMDEAYAIIRTPKKGLLAKVHGPKACWQEVRDDEGKHGGWSIYGSEDQEALLEIRTQYTKEDTFFDINPHQRIPTTEELHLASPDRLLQSLREDVAAEGKELTMVDAAGPAGNHLYRCAMDKQNNVEVRYKLFKPARPDIGRTDNVLENAQFVYRDGDGRAIATFLADRCTWEPAQEGLDGCWKLENGRIFIPTNLTPRDMVLQSSSNWLDYMSTTDLAELISHGRLRDEDAAKLARYTRYTAPIVNVIMLLVGLPFILSRVRDLKASAVMCLLMTASFLVFTYFCQYALTDQPLLAAWMPILVFGPISAVMLDSVKT